MKKLDVLFVGDKWLENNPGYGPSMHDGIILAPLESTDLASVRTLYYDETASRGESVDDRLLAACEPAPDLIVVRYSIGYPHLPKVETLARLRDAGVPIVFIWYDMVYWPNVQVVDERIVPVSSVNVVFDVAGYPTRFPEKYLNLWAPCDPRIFRDPDAERDLDVSHVGSQDAFPRRIKTIAALKSEGIDVIAGGGMGTRNDRRLSQRDYARILQRSRMSLNFSWASEGMPPAWYPLFPDQLKGRVFEIMSCGAMLLESENSQIQRFFIPYEDYVPWSSESDLLDKIRHYLAHEDERAAIARSGHRKAVDCYNARSFWRNVLDQVHLGKKVQGGNFTSTTNPA